MKNSCKLPIAHIFSNFFKKEFYHINRIRAFNELKNTLIHLLQILQEYLLLLRARNDCFFLDIYHLNYGDAVLQILRRLSLKRLISPDRILLCLLRPAVARFRSP